MSSKQPKQKLVGVRTPVKRPSGSAGPPELVEKKRPQPRIVPLTVKTITKKDKKTLTVKTEEEEEEEKVKVEKEKLQFYGKRPINWQSIYANYYCQAGTEDDVKSSKR